MRQNALNAANVEHRVALEEQLAGAGLILLDELAGELVIQFMAGFVGDQPASDRAANQKQIADQIQGLVTGAFIGETESIVDRPIRR